LLDQYRLVLHVCGDLSLAEHSEPRLRQT
jgi:hypothetical protein